MIRRWIILPLAVLLAAAAIVVIVLLALLSSEAGSRWLIHRTQSFAGEALSVGESEGRLLGPLTLRKIHIDLPPHRLEVETLTLDWRPLDLWRGRLTVKQLIAAGIRYEGPENGEDDLELLLPLTVVIEKAELERIELVLGESIDTIERLSLSAESNRRNVRISNLELQIGTVHITATAGADLPRLDNIGADFAWEMALADNENLFGRGRLHGDLDRLQLEHTLSDPFQVTSRGMIHLDQPDLVLDVEGEWRSLQWPVHGEAEVASDRGRYHFKGSLEAYGLDLSGDLHGPQMPSAQLRLEAKGTDGGLNIEELAIATLDGHLMAIGSVDWDDGLAFDLEVHGDKLNVGQFLPDWPGTVDRLDARIRAHFEAETYRFDAAVAKLEGRLRGYALVAAGAVRWDGTGLKMDNVRIDSGTNRLRMAGSIAETLALDLSVDAPDLRGLWPGLEGRLRGTGRLGGTRDAPRINLTLAAGAMAYGEYSARSLDLALDFDGRAGGFIDGQLEGTAIELGQLILDRLTIATAGTLDKHSIETAMKSDLGTLNARLAGTYRDRGWSGFVESLDLDSVHAGSWRLESRAPLVVASLGSEPRAGVEKLCLEQKAARVCAEGNWSSSIGFRSAGKIEALPLSLAQSYLPEGTAVQGTLEGRFRAERIGSRLSASADVFLSPGQVAHQDETAGTLRLDFSDASANLRLMDDTLDISYTFKLNGTGTGRGSLRLGPDEKLAGQLQVDFREIAALGLLLPRFDNLKGRFSADARLGGTVAHPDITVHGELQQASADLPELGLELRGIQLTLGALGSRTLWINGSMRSGPGTVRLEGTFGIDPAEGWPLQLRVRGENFQAARLPAAEVFVSPDLTVTAAKGEMRIVGSVQIPEAKIEVKELPPTAVPVSPDQVIIGAEPEAEAYDGTAAPHALNARIDVTLGNEVSLSGYGLRTDLTGRLEIAAHQGRTSAQGEVQTKKGQYRAYGQELAIERGRFLFVGPVDNPTMDIRATRTSKTDRVKAILTVTGPLKSPQTRISSEPRLPEHEALAYLLTGRPLSSADKNQSAMLARAALGYGLDYARPVTQRLGLDEFDVESDGTLLGSSLVLGKYLTPDLYIGYVTDLFSSTPMVQIRYRLTKHISAQTRAGATQSLDLLYTIEHD